MAIPRLPATQLTRGALTGHLTSFLESLGDGKTQTRSTYAYALREFLRWYDKDERCVFAVDDVFRYKQHLVGTKQLSSASVATYLNALRRFCSFLQKNGVIGYNPARTVRHRTNRSAQDTRTLSASDVRRLMDGAAQDGLRGKRDQAMMTLLIGYGLTEMEIVRLNCEDVVMRGGVGAILPGGNREKSILLSADMFALLTGYLSMRSDVKNGLPLFQSDGNRTRGLRMTTRGLRAAIEKRMHDAGILPVDDRKFTPSILRRTGAALMAEAGLPPDEIRYRMRFGTLATAKKFSIRHSQ
jgi:site-specific recombinase XerD